MKYDLLTHIKARPRRPIVKVNAIIAHWTANYSRGANAQANRNYFNLGSRHASAHYCVDSERIVKCLPHNEIGYHVGAKRYRPFRDIIAPGRNPNFYTIGFEMCVNSDGDWSRTVSSSMYLAAWLLHTFNLPIDRLARHFDVTGKRCPAMYVDQNAWNEFRQGVNFHLQSPDIQAMRRGVVTASALNIRSGASVRAVVLGQLQKGEQISYRVIEPTGEWIQVWPGHYVHRMHIDPV